MRTNRLVVVGLWTIVALLGFVVWGAAGQVTEDHMFKLGPHRTIAWEFTVYEKGEIRILVKWKEPVPLEFSLYGPGRTEPYLRGQDRSPLDVRFTIPGEAPAAGTGWQIKLTNPTTGNVSEGEITFSYPETLPTIQSFRCTLTFIRQDGAVSTYAGFTTDEFQLSWTTSTATELSMGFSCGPVPAELPPGVAEDCPSHSEQVPAASVEHGSRAQPSLSFHGAIFTLTAANDHGTTQATIRVLPKVPIGYQSAVCIGCMPCENCGHSSETERLLQLLQEIDTKVRAGCIRNNTNLDRFNDPYLRGTFTDDLLRAMSSLIIYPDDGELPDAGGRTVCDTGYGYTPGDKEYIMICLRKGADGLTLLHELEHYVDPNTTECRAAWVAQSCYGCPLPSLPCPTCSQ